jgi:hypothetical protein
MEVIKPIYQFTGPRNSKKLNGDAEVGLTGLAAALCNTVLLAVRIRL